MNRAITRVATLFAAALALASTACIHLDDLESGSFDKTYPLTGPLTLEMENGSGDIRITADAAGQVRVHGEVHLSDYIFAANPRGRVDEIKDAPPITQSGNVLRIARVPANGLRRARINYTIAVPPATIVRVRNGSGDVVVLGISGPVDLQTSSGDIDASRIAQRAVLAAGSGDITARDLEADLSATARSGDLELENIRGDVRSQTGSGDVRLKRPGGKVQVRVSSGSVTVDGVAADLRVNTSSGDLHVIGNPSPGSYWEVETRSGNALLDVPDTASIQLTAFSRSSGIDVDIPFEATERSRRSLRGKSGRGEARVLVETGSGRIRIR
jgi:DUF4097 and DUF4098 domain-containing protein YvlB